MEKQRYYISVGSGEILPEQSMASYELEIDATDADVRHLRELFEQIESESTKDFYRAHLPFVPYHEDTTNDRYNDRLIEIYRTLYKLGTPETKEHIESMGIL